MGWCLICEGVGDQSTVHVNYGSLDIRRVVGFSFAGMRPEPGRCQSLTLSLCGYFFCY